ncbi:unnamed protein product [Rhodiola kirilowii]
MDRIPVEVIGKILSGLGAARHIVIVSATCRKWREACKYLHTLSFSSVEWPRYIDLTTSELEISITQTIFLTKGLQRLSLVFDCAYFSAPSVHAWLIYTRETLLELRYNVRTSLRVNTLDIFGGYKLEVIELAHISIFKVDTLLHRFPCLKSLSLRYVSVPSALHLNVLLSVCPKIESLELINPRIAMFDVHKKLKLSSPTLKSIFVEAVRVDKLIVEVECLEIFHLKDCALDDFELIGKGLKQIKLDDVSITHLSIGENFESLEVVDISNFSNFRPIFFETILKSSSLRKLRLWNSNVMLEDGDGDGDEDEVEDMDEDEDEDEDEVEFEAEDEVEDANENEVEDANEDEDLETNRISTHQLNHYSVDLETIAVSFPKLSHLSLNYNLRDGSLNHSVQGSPYLTNVTVLELGWTVLTDVFSEWVESFLERCPNLKRLVIHGVIRDAKSQDKCHTLANFTSSMFRLMRNYMHVEVQFEFT